MRQAKRQIRSARQHGFTVVEVIVSGALVGTLLAFTVPMIRGIGHQQRCADRQQIARAEAANIMERIASRPWNDISNGSVAGLALSDESRRQLPEPRLQVTVKNDPARPEEKQIVVSIHWEENRNAPAAPVRLRSWVYERGRRP